MCACDSMCPKIGQNVLLFVLIRQLSQWFLTIPHLAISQSTQPHFSTVSVGTRGLAVCVCQNFRNIPLTFRHWQGTLTTVLTCLKAPAVGSLVIYPSPAGCLTRYSLWWDVIFINENSLLYRDPKIEIRCTHARTNWQPNNAFFQGLKRAMLKNSKTVDFAQMSWWKILIWASGLLTVKHCKGPNLFWHGCNPYRFHITD